MGLSHFRQFGGGGKEVSSGKWWWWWGESAAPLSPSPPGRSAGSLTNAAGGVAGLESQGLGLWRRQREAMEKSERSLGQRLRLRLVKVSGGPRGRGTLSRDRWRRPPQSHGQGEASGVEPGFWHQVRWELEVSCHVSPHTWAGDPSGGLAGGHWEAWEGDLQSLRHLLACERHTLGSSVGTLEFSRPGARGSLMGGGERLTWGSGSRPPLPGPHSAVTRSGVIVYVCKVRH